MTPDPETLAWVLVKELILFGINLALVVGAVNLALWALDRARDFVMRRMQEKW